MVFVGPDGVVLPMHTYHSLYCIVGLWAHLKRRTYLLTTVGHLFFLLPLLPPLHFLLYFLLPLAGPMLGQSGAHSWWWSFWLGERLWDGWVERWWVWEMG